LLVGKNINCYIVFSSFEVKVESANQDNDLENDNFNSDFDEVIDGEEVFIPKSECMYNPSLFSVYF